jgi:hypothetical protein
MPVKDLVGLSGVARCADQLVRNGSVAHDVRTRLLRRRNVHAAPRATTSTLRVVFR